MFLARKTSLSDNLRHVWAPYLFDRLSYGFLPSPFLFIWPTVWRRLDDKRLIFSYLRLVQRSVVCFLSEFANPNQSQIAAGTLLFYQTSSFSPPCCYFLSFCHCVVAAGTSEHTLKCGSLGGAFQQYIDFPYTNIVRHLQLKLLIKFDQSPSTNTRGQVSSYK